MNKQFIENTILKLCIEPRNFDYLSKNIYGLDPISLNEYLLNLEKDRKIKKYDEAWVIKGYRRHKKSTVSPDESKQDDLNKYIPYFNVFKKSHPLDFEWRNSLDTLNYLCNLITQSNSKKDRVLLLGMPSLFISTFLKRLPQEIILVDKNEALLSSVSKLVKQSRSHSIIQDDIFTISPSQLGMFNQVFIDPPWYSDHFFQFIWLASQCIEIGGSLAISLPPINTRPGIVAERQEWFSFCEQQGLYLEMLFSQRMEYVMPFFEFNALRAAGIHDILPFWRKGDLAVLKKIENKATERPKAKIISNDWAESDIDGVRFRINTKSGKENVDLEIDHIITGDILPSVSSRDLRRKDANVWTSGNRIFKVNKPRAFLDLAESYKKNNENLEMKSSLAEELIKFVVEIEKKEYINYKDWLLYEMEKETSKKTD